MDLATRLLHWKEQPPEQWARAANRYLPHAVSALLVLALAYKLAELTWTLMPGPPLDAPLPAVNAPSIAVAAGSQPTDLSGVVDKHLFGEASVEPVPVVEDVVDAPDTTLSLELRGVVASDNNKNGWAIIADGRGQEKTYFVSDSIDGGGGALLHAVYGDRVILNRAGRLETLRLPRELAARSRTVAPRPSAPAPSAAPDSLRNVLSENASRITDVIRVAPHIEQGQMVGFRVNPGQEREQFAALGLQPGDVVTDVNGTAMTDPSRGLQVFEALGESTMANVTVVRNGVPEVLVIDTSQLQELAGGLQ